MIKKKVRAMIIVLALMLTVVSCQNKQEEPAHKDVVIEEHPVSNEEDNK